MIPISIAFRQELDRQIRRPGHVEVILNYKSGGSYTVPEFYIQKVELHSTADPLCRRLPVEECTVVLLDYDREWDPANPDGRLADMADGAAILIRFGIENALGTVLWTDTAVYWSDNQPTFGDYKVKFHGTREIGQMTAAFPGIRDEDTFLELLADSIVGENYGGDTDPRDISTDFDSTLAYLRVLPHATLDAANCADALLAVAFAAGLCLKTTYDGTVEILDRWYTDTVKNLSVVKRNDMLEEPKLDRLPLLRNAICTYYDDPQTDPDRVTVLEYSGTASPTEASPLVLPFSENVAGGSFRFDTQTNVSSITYQVFRGQIEITQLVRTSSSDPVVLKGSGVPARPEKDIRVFQNSFAGSEPTSENEEIDNPLMYGDVNLGLVHAMYLTKARDLYSVAYRGDPSIEPLDIIRMELPFAGVAECIVLETTFTFEYGFSGSISARRILNPSIDQHIHRTALSDLAVSDAAMTDRTEA